MPSHDWVYLLAGACGLAALITGPRFYDWCERRNVPHIDVAAIGEQAAHPRPQLQTRTFRVPGNEDVA